MLYVDVWAFLPTRVVINLYTSTRWLWGLGRTFVCAVNIGTSISLLQKEHVHVYAPTYKSRLGPLEYEFLLIQHDSKIHTMKHSKVSGTYLVLQVRSFWKACSRPPPGAAPSTPSGLRIWSNLFLTKLYWMYVYVCQQMVRPPRISAYDYWMKGC